MSSDGRTVGPSDRNTPAPSASVHPTRPTVRPTVRLSDLGSIAHPPDPIARVVGDQQGTVRRDDEPDRATPARAVGQLPAGDEVLDGRRPPALHTDAHHFRARRRAAVPGAVIRHERVALVLGRKHRPRIERLADAGRVRLHAERWELYTG